MKKRGITIISLSIVIIVMLIILSIVSVSLNYSISNAKKMAFAKEIYNIQSMVDEYIVREETLPNAYQAITVTPTVEIAETQFEGETFTNGTVNLYVLDLKELDIKNTNYGNKKVGSTDIEKEKDIYAVSEKTGKVYYIAGFQSDGKKYYTLTDELRQMIEKNQNISIGEKTITFTPSKLGWSNEGVSVDVFVPEEFTSPSITIDNANITYTSTSDSNGVYYIVNNEKVVEGYTITVNYTKNGTTGTATYTAKVDTVTPVISKNAGILNTETRINGLESNDNKSGIKYFKYAEGVIDENDVKEYIHAYGKNIKKGSLKFDSKTKYTLYAEDKAGNYVVMYIDRFGNLVETIPPSPTLAASDDWYKGSAPKNTITTINIVDVIDETIATSATESWPAAVDSDGNGEFDNSIMCYLNGTTLTIAGDGSGEIMANKDSSWAFSENHGDMVSGTYFDNLTNINGLNILNTSKVTNMAGMFDRCRNLSELDVSGFDTSKVTSMLLMFEFCDALTNLDVSGFDTGKVTNMGSMFANCKVLTELDVSGFDTSEVTDLSYMFHNCNTLTELDVSGFDTSKVTNMDGVFWWCDNITKLDVSGFDTGKVTNMRNMFYSCDKITELDVSGFDTSNVTNMEGMFYECINAKELDVSGFDTSKVTDMSAMFYNCNTLTELDVSGFDTGKVIDMGYMFDSCSSLTKLDVTSFDTSKVPDMTRMFCGCRSLNELDISNFNTSNVTNMTAMFWGCSSLKTIDVSSFDTSNVTKMGYMFSGCDALTKLSLTNFDTSNVTAMGHMFYGCKNLAELDISVFDTTSVISGDTSIFASEGLVSFAHHCPKLNKIILGENFGKSSNVLHNGINVGMFYADSITDTTVYGANDVMKAYDWAGDNRNVTFETVSP